MYSIKQYTPDYFEAWNNFVAASKNGTFLFHRNFMEYHANRFADFSLMVYNGAKLVALLPANRVDGVVYSHQGLTYGGLVLGFGIYLYEVIDVMKNLLEYLQGVGVNKLHVKSIPAIYHKAGAQELEYILFLCNATLTRRDSLSVIENEKPIGITRGRRNAINRGIKNGLQIAEDNNFDLFWETVLIPNLRARHNAKPVHTVEEIKLLKQRFPDAIRHFNVYDKDTLVAGTTIFLTDTVAHPQYISGTDERSALGSLDFLYDQLITLFKDKKYFDFGPSTLETGRKLNKGILFWKESYGARTIIQDFYEIDTASHELLNNVL